ncbi:MAG: TadE/TadG family type IV pilus assembly protein [Chloroflexota bacterium]
MSRGRRRSSRGQALTEFALVAPIFFLLVFSIIELGILFGGQNGLVAATRELARYAAPYRVKTAVDATNVCADTRLGTQLTGFLKQSIPGYASTNVASREVIYSWRTNPLVTGQPQTYYVQLQIKVAYKFQLRVPLVGGILDRFDGTTDNRLLLDAKEQMRIENEDLTTPYGDVTCSI